MRVCVYVCVKENGFLEAKEENLAMTPIAGLSKYVDNQLDILIRSDVPRTKANIYQYT